jgi:CheY-like chemotaxis protein
VQLGGLSHTLTQCVLSGECRASSRATVKLQVCLDSIIVLKPSLARSSRAYHLMCMRVLVVEDEFLQRREIAVALAAAGYETDEASQDALERMRRRLPNLILLDLRMPRMNGLEFGSAQLKDLDLATVPVVVLSATPGDASISAACPAGVLTKPVNLAALLKLIRDLRIAS